MNEVSPISDWHTCRDILWLGGERIRRHTFWDERNPIRGLTSDILILASRIAYQEEPQYSHKLKGQPSQADLIKMAFEGPLAVKKFRVKPRMQFLKAPDGFSFTNSYESTNDDLEQPQDEKHDFVLAPPIGDGASTSNYGDGGQGAGGEAGEGYPSQNSKFDDDRDTTSCTFTHAHAHWRFSLIKLSQPSSIAEGCSTSESKSTPNKVNLQPLDMHDAIVGMSANNGIRITRRHVRSDLFQPLKQRYWEEEVFLLQTWFPLMLRRRFANEGR